MTQRTVVATVTYGRRLHLLGPTIDAAARCGVNDFVVVANGLDAETLDGVYELLAPFPRSEVRVLDRNTGSAGGFAEAFNGAKNFTDCSWVWFLDDDNRVRDGALAHAQDALTVAAATYNSSDLAAVCNRSQAHSGLAAGEHPDDVYDTAGSFLHFDLLTYFRKQRRVPVPGSGVVEVPNGPYGGLLLQISTLQEVAPPNKDFVVYEDDTEFTQRLRSHGVRLLWVRDAVVDDLVTGGADSDVPEPVAPLAARPLGPIGLLRTESEWQPKVFYQTRNTIYVERQRAAATGRLLRFALNGGVYAVVVAVLSLSPSNRVALPMVSRATRDALRGRLGEVVEL